MGVQVDEEPQEDGSVKLRFVLPAAVAPRYTPHHYHRHDLSQAFMPGATAPPVEPGQPCTYSASCCRPFP